MNETEILIKVKVFSDPEYCTFDDRSCGNMYEVWADMYCGVFGSRLSHGSRYLKCDSCKEALKQASK